MNWLSSLLGNLNYGTIFFLMLLESTVIPVPSELVVSPAAYHAAGGNLNVFLVILFATIGADCGATINYFAGYYLGRPIIYRFANSKWGRMCLLNQQKLEKSEKFFYDHGVIATLTGRLLPGIRHLISIPAGLSKMKFWKFILYTTIGAVCGTASWHCWDGICTQWFPSRNSTTRLWNMESISSWASSPLWVSPSCTSSPNGFLKKENKHYQP